MFGEQESIMHNSIPFSVKTNESRNKSGSLYVWNEQENVQITQEQSNIVVQGINLKAKIETEGLRLTKEDEIVSNKTESYQEAVLKLEGNLVACRKYLDIVTNEKEEINTQLDSREDLEDEEVEELEKKLHDKRAIIRKCKKKIKEWENQATLKVRYQVGKISVMMPPGLMLQPKFLSKPICWCPCDEPSSIIIDDLVERFEEIPRSLIISDEQVGKNLTCWEEEARSLTPSLLAEDQILTSAEKEAQSVASDGKDSSNSEKPRRGVVRQDSSVFYSWLDEEKEPSSCAEEKKTLNKLTSATHSTAAGDGLNRILPCHEAQFIITAKDSKGQPRGCGGDNFVVESTELSINYFINDREDGTYNVSYVVLDSSNRKECFSLDVTHCGKPISGSPFQVRRGYNCTYQHDFDKNGVFYYLGTNGKKKSSWRNPHHDELVCITTNATLGTCGSEMNVTVADFLSPDVQKMFNACQKGGWVQIDLLDTRLKPTAYTLKHGWPSTDHALRNWCFEASNDGETWIILRDHRNDTRLGGFWASATWPIDCDASFRYFRISITGPNSRKYTYHFNLCAIELYGLLF